MEEMESSIMNVFDQKDYSEEEEEEVSNSSEPKNFILDIDERPDTIIEKMLIDIFNNTISHKSEEDNIAIYQEKVKRLCLNFQSHKIILLLLSNIRNIIKKYKIKILEMPDIKKFRNITIKPLYFRKKNNSIVKNYSYRYNTFKIERGDELNSKSFSRGKKNFDFYFSVVKNLFNKLRHVKICLKKVAPIIEKVFELPLSEFEKFSIYELEKAGYLSIIIHDDFIWNEIISNKNKQFNKIIQEITEGNNGNINTLTNKIDYFESFCQERKIQIAETSSSIDRRYPEDAKPLQEISLKEESSRKNNFMKNEIGISSIKIGESDTSNLINNTLKNFKEYNSQNLEDIKILGNINEKINFKKEILKKKFPFAEKKNIYSSIKINNITEENINCIGNDKANILNLFNKEKSFKNKNKIITNKKESNNNVNKKITNKNNNYKIDKKEIPSDIDDLVKFIENDDKNETKNKKKKKNKKKAKKKNKTEETINKEGENMNEEEMKKQKEDEEFNELKENILKNSINRFKIHKIKFKYKPEWLEQISKII